MVICYSDSSYCYRRISSGGSATIQAIKVEYGTQQTLAHLEGNTWVLNEMPDYNEELIKCETNQTAPLTDTYANKSLATEQQLAYVETGTIASRTYRAGEYFCKDGKTCRTKTNIASGASFTLDTNYEVLPGGGFNGLATTISGIAANSSITLNVPYYAAGLVATARSTTGHRSLAFVTAADISVLVSSGSITYSLSGNTLTISNGTGNAVTVYIYNFNPTIPITVN